MRVSRLELSHFRGVPHEVAVDFRTRPEEAPRSLLLFGDNGTGKSSIVDGLEFGLRGRVSRLVLPRQEERRVLSSLAGGEPAVRVGFDSGLTVVRGGTAAGDGDTDLGLQPVEGFGLAPVVLRRSDILRFWEVPASQRQLVFFPYFRGPGWGNRDSTRKASQAEAAVERAERDRDAAVQALVKATHIDPARVPGDNVQLDAWRSKELGPKFGRRVERPGRAYYSLPSSLNATLGVLSGANRRLKNARRTLERAQRDLLQPGTTPGGVLVREILAQASGELSSAFRSISGAPHVADVELILGDGDQVRLDVVIRLANGTTADAQDVLSESSLDLLALLVFTSIVAACADHGQERILVFDDVFQSVDSTIRTAVVAFLLDRFAEWQLIFTLHDRLWLTRLSEMCRQRSHRILERRIVRWTFDGGPVIRDAVLSPGAELRHSLERGELVPIASTGGLLLEEIADRLSWTIGSGVTRRYGDRYTLGDLWPGVSKYLKKSSAKAVAVEIDSLLQLRNLVGAHYNEWAQSLTDVEGRDFGEAVLGLLAYAFCPSCGSWVAASADGKPPWRCQCGETAIAPP